MTTTCLENDDEEDDNETVVAKPFPHDRHSGRIVDSTGRSTWGCGGAAAEAPSVDRRQAVGLRVSPMLRLLVSYNCDATFPPRRWKYNEYDRMLRH
jgi:hypothetical protein